MNIKHFLVTKLCSLSSNFLQCLVEWRSLKSIASLVGLLFWTTWWIQRIYRCSPRQLLSLPEEFDAILMWYFVTVILLALIVAFVRNFFLIVLDKKTIKLLKFLFDFNFQDLLKLSANLILFLIVKNKMFSSQSF